MAWREGENTLESDKIVKTTGMMGRRVKENETKRNNSSG
jgi:hypothetical protein